MISARSPAETVVCTFIRSPPFAALFEIAERVRTEAPARTSQKRDLSGFDDLSSESGGDGCLHFHGITSFRYSQDLHPSGIERHACPYSLLRKEKENRVTAAGGSTWA